MWWLVCASYVALNFKEEQFLVLHHIRDLNKAAEVEYGPEFPQIHTFSLYLCFSTMTDDPSENNNNTVLLYY